MSASATHPPTTPTLGSVALESPAPVPVAPVTHLATAGRPQDEEGSLVTEYGLLAVVAATIAGVIISWASNGALVTLFNALLRHARGLVGA
jgi:Flp pilus assembly pilin Flp